MPERLEGRVAMVVNTRELVINKGAVDGVKVGMRFAVLGKPLEIRDPESGASLGSVDTAKTIVKVVRVGTHTAVARTFRTYETGFMSVASRSQHFEEIAVEDEVLEELRVSQPKLVEAGDRLIETVGDEFDFTN